MSLTKDALTFLLEEIGDQYANGMHLLDSMEYQQLLASGISWLELFSIIEDFDDFKKRTKLRELSEVYTQDQIKLNFNHLDLEQQNEPHILAELYFYFGLLGDPLLDKEQYFQSIQLLAELYEQKLHQKGSSLNQIHNKLYKPKLSVFGKKNIREVAELCIETLNELCFEDHMLKPESSSFFNMDSHRVDKLLTTSAKGIPLSLSALYVIIAQKSGLPVYGVNMPRHFLVKWQYQGVEFFIDPYNYGEVIRKESIYQLLSQNQVPVSPKSMEPTSYRIMIKRALTNLIPLFKKEPSTEKSMLIQSLIKLLDAKLDYQ